MRKSNLIKRVRLLEEKNIKNEPVWYQPMEEQLYEMYWPTYQTDVAKWEAELGTEKTIMRIFDDPRHKKIIPELLEYIRVNHESHVIHEISTNGCL